MPEIALRLPIAFFAEQISDFALHPDAMCHREVWTRFGFAGLLKSQKDCRYEREIFS
jgi:hypothetical protein